VAGLLLFAAGAVLFWPAAIVGRYGFFLAALFVIAAGLSFLETAANSFVAQMGPPASAARRLNLAQAFNTLGSIAGVLAGTLFIFSGIELSAPDAAAMAAAGTYAAYLHRETMRVVMPYLALALFACALALVFLRIRLPATGEGVDASRAGSSRALLHSRHLLFAVTAQFLYVGAQVGTWSWFIQYVEQYAGQPERHAGLLLTGTLAAFAVGRFSAPAIMRRVPAAELMLVYALINAALLAFAVLRPGWGGVGAVFLTSFFMSIMYPTIFALGVEGLGVHVKLGGAVLVMAIIGGAALPPVMAWISERSSIAMAYLAPLLCYLGVAAFARYHLGHGGAANAAGAASVGA
jgi:FHS family L-fucose permease-like MFS transporter